MDTGVIAMFNQAIGGIIGVKVDMFTGLTFMIDMVLVLLGLGIVLKVIFAYRQRQEDEQIIENATDDQLNNYMHSHNQSMLNDAMDRRTGGGSSGLGSWKGYW